jgi:PAS domain S-box-containing protein
MINTLKTINYHKESIQTLLNAKAGGFGANFLAPLIMVVILYDKVPHWILSVWMGTMTLVFIGRVVIAQRMLNRIDKLSTKVLNKCLKLYLVAIFFNAFLLGLTSTFTTIYADTLYLLFTATLLFGVISGSFSTLTPVFHAVFIFVLVSLTVFIIGMLWFGSSYEVYMAAFIFTFYTIIVLPSSFRVFSAIENNIHQREEIKGLNNSLEHHVINIEESNRNFQGLLDVTMEAIVILDNQRNLIDLNASGLRLFNVHDKAKVLDHNVLEFVPKHSLAKVQEMMQNENNHAYEMDLQTVDGKRFPALVSSQNLYNEGRVYRIATILDLTKLKDRDKQLLQHSRLAQMGEMISMIAHQWRQPLSAISTTAINLRVKMSLEAFDLDTQEGRDKQNSYFDQQLSKVEEYVKGLTVTIDDFRNFYKPNKEFVSVRFEEVIEKTLGIIKASLENDNIVLEYDYRDHEAHQVYDSEMIQVVLNLLKNAQDNFREKKTVSPRISITITQHTLEICDNGGGIPEEIIGSIFDPYFSTKDEKNGTGLGLYMSKMIIEEHHNGTLKAINQDDGVCFVIDLSKGLPLASKEPA